MLQTQAIKSLEETCETLVCKAQTEPNPIARSDRMSAQRDLPQWLVISLNASWRGLILLRKKLKWCCLEAWRCRSELPF